MKAINKSQAKTTSGSCCSQGQNFTTAQCCSKNSKVVAGCHD